MIIACPKCGSDKIKADIEVTYDISSDGEMVMKKEPKLNDAHRFICRGRKCGHWGSPATFSHESKPKTGDPCKACRGTGKVERESFNGYAYKDSCSVCSGNGKLTISKK